MKGGACPCSGTSLSGGSRRRYRNKSRKSKIMGGNDSPNQLSPLLPSPTLNQQPVTSCKPCKPCDSSSNVSNNENPIKTPSNNPPSNNSSSWFSNLNPFTKGGASRKKHTRNSRRKRRHTRRRRN